MNQKKKLYNILTKSYFKYFAPDYNWNLNNWDLIFDVNEKTIVYYCSKDNRSSSFENIYRLILEREPVNIEMERYFHKNIFQEFLSLTNFDYSEYYLKNARGPYSLYSNSVTYALYIPKILINLPYEFRINVINVIAPAFDSEKQPDYYKFFIKNNIDYNIKLDNRFELIFSYIFRCIVDNNFKNVFITGFGIGAFKNDDKYYVNGFIRSFKKFKNLIEDVNIYYLSFNKKRENGIKTLKNHNIFTIMKNKNIELYDRITNLNFDRTCLPESILKISYNFNIDIDESLFVNPWDPFSIVGNGNSGDDSWDGSFGKFSSIGIRSLMQFNKPFKFIDTSDNF